MALINSESYKKLNEAYLSVLNEASLEEDKNKKEENEEKVGVIKDWTRESLTGEIKRYLSNVPLEDDLKNALAVIYILVLKLYPNNDDIVSNDVVAKVKTLFKGVAENELKYNPIKRLSIKEEGKK